MVRRYPTRVRAWRLRAVIAAAALLALPSLASARTETFTWSHGNPSGLGGFKLYWGTASGSYGPAVVVGLPQPNSNGTYSHALSVPDTATIYVVVTAYGSTGLESGYSNERVRAPASTPPPTTPPPPSSTVDPAAIWNQNFSSVATGNAVSGWVDTEANGSLAQDDSLFKAVDLSGNRVLSTSSTASDIHSHYISTGSASWTSYELRGSMMVTSTAGRIGVTSTSKFTSANVLYRLSSNWDTGELELAWSPWDNTTKSCTSRGTGVTPLANTWYRYRFQVQPTSGSTTLRAKVWANGAPEPANWQAQCVDSAASRPTTGTIGVWSGSGGSKYWDDFQVIPVSATGGGSSPSTLGAPGQPFVLP